MGIISLSSFSYQFFKRDERKQLINLNVNEHYYITFIFQMLIEPGSMVWMSSYTATHASSYTPLSLRLYRSLHQITGLMIPTRVWYVLIQSLSIVLVMVQVLVLVVILVLVLKHVPALGNRTTLSSSSYPNLLYWIIIIPMDTKRCLYVFQRKCHRKHSACCWSP